MIELKPRCAGCGTGNAIDAEYCIECGIKITNGESTHFFDENGILLSDVDTTTLEEVEAPLASEDIGFEYNNGKYEIFDGNDNNKILFESSNLEEAKERLEIIMKSMNVEPISKCDHTLNLVANLHCECVKCMKCDKRTETCFKHTPKFDYALQTKKKNSLDHLKESLSPKTPFPVDKRLDFRSNQLADWYFKDEAIPCEYKDCMNTKPHHTYHSGSGENASSGLDRPIPIKHFGRNRKKCDCDGIKTICDNYRAKQEKAPYSAIIGIDVRKGIKGRKIPPKKRETRNDHILKKNNEFSKIEKSILKFSTLAIIISLGILYFM